MKFALDEYAGLESPIHRWDVRYKLIGLTSLIFAYASVRDLRLIPAMLVVTGILYTIAKLPFSFLIRRLRYPSFFLLGVIILLPFFSGKTVIWQLGFLTVRQEGCLAAVLIVSRFLAIITTALVLFGSNSFLATIKGMRDLGLSKIIVDTMLLSYRYLFELARQLSMMEKAAKLRGFRPRKLTRRNLSVYAALTGSLLVRSYDRSQQVYQAMLLRGYGNEETNKKIGSKIRSRQSKFDAIALFISLIIALGFITAEIFW